MLLEIGLGGKATGRRGTTEQGVHMPRRGLFLIMAVLLGTAASSALAAPTRSTAERLDEKRYVAAGDRAYVVGAENGRFPPMGWHIRGEMGGVWAHPIKLLDGYWFSLNGEWLPSATRFTSGAGYVRMAFPAVNGFEVTRTEFSPDGAPVVLVGLTVTNPASGPRAFHLRMHARSELMGAYPWGWTQPSAKAVNGRDLGSFDAKARTLAFQEPGKPWYAVVGSSAHAAGGAVGDGFWGPVPDSERADYLENGNGTGGELRWNLTLDGQEVVELWVAVAGSHTSRAEADRALRSALADPDALLASKVAAREAVLARTRVSVPDAQLQEALEWGKLNMADLRRTVRAVQVRDVQEGRAYPPPLGTIQSLTGIGAGYPDYPWYFGTDGAYTSFPLVAAGQWETAKEHLRAIRDVSRLVNGRTGKVVHEVVTDGSVYWGAVNAPGNTNETAQFAVAAHLLWRWSGDDGFRDEMYAFVRDGLRHITSPGCPANASGEGTCDNDGDGWPEGFGMVERAGMGAEKLDVTAYTWQALRALEEMAADRSDAATATWAGARAERMERAFEDAWWMRSESLYADSLCNPGDPVPADVREANGWTNVCTAAGEQLQQRHWINATPMETALARADRARAALDLLESSAFTGGCGLYHTGVGGGPDGKGELKCWTLPTSVMAVAEANYGRLGPGQALNYVDAIADQLDLEMPGALPEIAPSPEFDPFVDFRERAMVMQAWSSYGTLWPVIHQFLGIDPNLPAGGIAVVPDVPDAWPGLSVENLRVGSGALAASASKSGNRYLTTVEAPAGWALTIGHTLPAGDKIRSVTLDGAPAAYAVFDTPRGREVRVRAATGGTHTLMVITG
jgi:glycogen debranching enzyme